MAKKKYISTPKDAFLHLSEALPDGRSQAALRILAEQIDMMNHKDKEQHWLFAKLFLHIFNDSLQRHKTSKAGTDLLRIALRKPMEDHFLDIKKSLDLIDDLKTFEIERADLSHEKAMNGTSIPGDRKSVAERIKSSLTDELDIKFTMTEYINLFLNDKKNYS